MLENPIRDYSDLSSTDACRLLCYIGNRLTAEARMSLLTSSDYQNNMQRNKTYNELFHQIFGQIGSLVEEDEKRYSADAFVDIMTGLSYEGNFGAEFASAWRDAMKYVRRPSRP